MFSKIFERLIYNALFKHFIDNDLISSTQSSFNLGDSCINEFIVKTHIFKGLDDELEEVFFLISLKLWDEGLIYKLCHNGICGNPSYLLLSFLDSRMSRMQQVLLNGRCHPGVSLMFHSWTLSYINAKSDKNIKTLL